MNNFAMNEDEEELDTTATRAGVGLDSAIYTKGDDKQGKVFEKSEVEEFRDAKVDSGGSGDRYEEREDDCDTDHDGGEVVKADELAVKGKNAIDPGKGGVKEFPEEEVNVEEKADLVEKVDAVRKTNVKTRDLETSDVASRSLTGQAGWRPSQ
jgi:hypothetical protein